MLRLLVPFLLLVLAVGVMVISDEPERPADFSFINKGDISTMDVQRMSWMQDLRVGRIVYEGLVRNDVFTPDYHIIPAGAQSWEISEDGKTYTFHLRPDAKWSNGEPVRASDYVYAWRRGILPDTACDYASQYQLIRGAAEFFKWRDDHLNAFDPKKQPAADLWNETKRTFDQMVGITAPDDLTLRVELVRRTPYFLDLMSLAVFYPVYPPLVSKYELPDPRTGRLKLEQEWTKPPQIVSNGPFVVKSWRFKREMRLEANPQYWNRAALKIHSISMPTVEDPNAAVMTFGAGGVDWVSDVMPAYRADMLAAKQQFYAEHQQEYDRLVAQGLDPIAIDRALPHDARKNIHAFPAFGTYFFNVNCMPKLAGDRPNPLADTRVRRALAMSFDRGRIARDIRRIGESENGNLVPPGSIAGYTGPKGLSYSPEQARALMAQAGYPGGKGFITLEILVNKDGGHDVVAQAMAKDWQENLGISVVIIQKEIKVFRNDLKEHDFMISRAGWYGDYGDPCSFLEINRTGDGNNDRGYASPAYDALLDRANEEPDPAKRFELLAQAERMIVEEDLPLLPILQYRNVVLFDPDRISGITSHPRQEQNLFLVEIMKDGKGADKAMSLPPHK